MRLRPLEIGEYYGLLQPVTQLQCEVCGKGEFGECRYFRRIGGLCVCLRRIGRKDERILR